ncbi:MAG: putative baseplate assembly protein, partial [Opitutaceae bacterium]|nr:putative baseplate assembly protein [Verrucomicrobiales bacterium]
MIDQPTLTCQNEQRRQKVRGHKLNGLDYIEVSEDQRTLTAYFIDETPPELFPEKGEEPAVYQKRVSKLLRVEGGRRIRDIRAEQIEAHKDFIVVKVNKVGDFSTYELCLVEIRDGRPTGKPFPGFDPRYSCAAFSFKIGCPSDLDCKTEAVCPPEQRDEPEINYLAKDYASFRQLILDRLALIMPDWQERHVPDIGVALVEVLAYV